MTSTKLMGLGILTMLLGLAMNDATTSFVVMRTLGMDVVVNLPYLAVALVVIGFVVGVVGFFRR